MKENAQGGKGTLATILNELKSEQDPAGQRLHSLRGRSGSRPRTQAEEKEQREDTEQNHLRHRRLHVQTLRHMVTATVSCGPGTGSAGAAPEGPKGEKKIRKKVEDPFPS